jgi:rhodanese-related sulfurtransferase
MEADGKEVSKGERMQHTPGFIALCEIARAQVKVVSIEAVKHGLDRGCLLIDVREDHEWQRGHLPQAEHLGRGVIERDIETRVPNKHTPIILYCGGGHRSVLAADSLQKMGYTDVSSMEGGWRAWNEAAYPVV